MRGFFVAPFVLSVCLSLFGAGHDVTPPTFGPTAYQVGVPIVATNGDTFLTLWTMNTLTAGNHVYGSLADANGTLLTPVSFLVAPNATILQLIPAGHEYLAVISDPARAVRIATISEDGRLLGYGPDLPIHSPQYPRVAFNGRELFAVDYVNSLSAPGQPVAHVQTLDGEVVRKTIPIPTQFANYDVISAGSNFILVQSGLEGVFLHRFSSDGTELGPKTLIDRDYGSTVTLASDGSDTVVAWTRRIGGPDQPPQDILNVAIVENDGTVSGHAQLPVAAVSRLSLLWNGTTYLLVGQSWNGAFATRIDRTGRIVDGAAPIDTGASAAVIGNVVYAVGLSSTQRPSVGTSFRIDDGIKPGDTRIISNTLRRQLTPGIASDGLEFLVSFTDSADITTKSVSRLSRSGAALQSQADLGPTVGVPSSIAFGESTYLIAWSQNGYLVARRFSAAGISLDQQPIVIANQAWISDQAIAWNGRSFLIVWSQGNGTFCSFVDEDGVVTSPKQMTDVGYTPEVIWDGQRYLASWIAYQSSGLICTCAPTPVGLIFRTVSADGTPQPGTAHVDGYVWRWHVATSGREYVVVADWQQSTTVFAIRTDGTTLVVGQPVTPFQWFREIASAVTWDGKSYLIAMRYGDGAARSWLSMTRLVPDQTFFFPEAVKVGRPDSDEAPAIAANSQAEAAVAISEKSAPGVVSRVRSYSQTDFQPMPQPPPPPSMVFASGSSTSATIQWSAASGDVEGYLVEGHFPYAVVLAVTDAQARSAFVTVAASSVSVRAFNAGGTSDPVRPAFITPPPRHRASGH